MLDLLTALALVLVIEGITLSLFPEHMQRVMARMQELHPSVLRTGGLIAAVIGVGVVWLIRG